MSLITSSATLNAAVAEYLNRADLSSSNVGIDLMIQQAEARIKRDSRIRSLGYGTFSVDADDEAGPTGFKTLVSLEHNGPNYYGPLEIVGPNMIGELKGRYGATGVPKYVAVIDSAGSYYFRFAPVPSTTFALRIVFWQAPVALSSGSNWLVTAHPDIYLYATLCESAMYLKDDARLALWTQEYESRVEMVALDTWEHAYSGGPIRQQFTPIGG